jgi:hypothetical protein
MGANTNNLGLSSTSTRQLERIIDDAAWITYPLHVLVGILKMFVFVGLCIVAVFVSTAVWLMTAHDNRAEWTKNFVAQESVYRVNFVNKTVADRPVVVKKGTQYLDTDVSQMVWECPETSEGLKKYTMFDDSWLEKKSDAFQSAYITASCNMVGLTERLQEAKGDYSHLPSMPNAPVVYVSFLKSTDYEQMVPADYQGNWYTGMCLVGANCTDADFVPRNDSIFYDAIAPQMTGNQDAAVKALYATATPKFWIAAAHANGIYDKDAEFAGYAADEGLDLAKKLRHQESSSDEFAHEVEIGIGLYVAFIVLLCMCFTRRSHKFKHSCEN